MAGRRGPRIDVPRARPGAVTAIPTKSLVASSVRYSGKTARVYSPPKEWQKEAYRHYGICGEARYAANYFGHLLSKASLYAATDLLTAERITSGPAHDAVQDLFNGGIGQAQMLSAVGKHLTIAGDCYLVGRNVEITNLANEVVDTMDVWEVLSCLEVRGGTGQWFITSDEEGQPDIPLTEEDAVIRIWRPHPERRLEADSPFRSLLPVLSEIEWLTRHIFAQCSSRLANAGIAFLSQGIQAPPVLDDQGKPRVFQNEAEGLMYALATASMRALEHPESAESLVPIFAAVDEELMKSGGKVFEQMKFWTELDEKALEMRSAAVHRFALGMDLDPTAVEGSSTGASTGGGNSNGPNHWGMWQIKEETVTIHAEPMLDLVCNALTLDYLRKATDGVEVMRYDTTKMHLRPDRSKESMELFNMGLLKGSVPVRENGFEPTEDMPDENERKDLLLWKIASGSATPDQVAAAAAILGVEIPGGPAGPQAPRETRPDPSLEDHPTRDLPEFPKAASLLLHTTEPLVFQALQRVGNRLKAKMTTPPTCPAYEIHTLVTANGSTANVMKDAFPSASMCLEGVADPAKVVPVLESYVENLITQQAPHTRERLAKWLEAAT